MNPLILTPLLQMGSDLINRLFPDKTKAAEAQNELLKMVATNDFATVMKQLEVNAVEAQSSSTFVAGWRPFIGWICGLSLGLIYVPKAIVMSGVWTYQAVTLISGWDGSAIVPALPDYPDLGVSDLVGLLCGMLGMAGFRTVEKLKGVAQ